MRILHIMASKAEGGAETYALDLILSLHQAHVQQCVVLHRKAPRYNELHRAGVKLAPWVLWVPFKIIQKLLVRILIALWHPKIVQGWMRRGASLIPLTPQSRRNYQTVGWFGGYYDPRYFQSCDDLVGVTSDIQQHMIQRGVDPKHAHFVPTFPVIVPQPPLDRALVATEKDAKVLLTLSRLHPKKGLDTFLHAVKNLPNCVAWIAGSGPLRAELERLASDLGIMSRVRFLGWRTDRSALLRSADVCVLPSRYEPFGTVILEAWAAGTPLVATNSAGPAAHVQNGVTGLLTPIDDVDGLTQTIRRVLSDIELRRTLIAQGYATYLQSYTPDAVRQKWQELYGILAADGGDAPAPTSAGGIP